ncbi:(E3-independent) E2 ubiquitin-conjugating enzyme UBE2O isoform X2 [Cimex lectularius]|uniref:UBC core domain-containing protein n=1 Tax=Cimex lectularius TaxID=79782 RepID=A0A8I6SC70_CIMLE|nr:(E3-independent) E2 ubiquitin-conjugating enzyme UBE2O isoform X2 [Cimex lectularius]
MASEHQYFYEDEVYRINKKGNIEFGMVLENSELVSSDDNSDNEECAKIKKGHIRVTWHPTGAEEVVSERKVGLADRSLMPGDVVRRMIKGKDTQRGYCRHIEVMASIQIVGTRHIINKINSKDLNPIEILSRDQAVCLDSWVGGIKVVHTKIHLRLPDMSKCVVTDPDTVGFDIFDEKKDPDVDFPHRGDYYPGQVLWGPLSFLDEIAEREDPTHTREQIKLRSKNNKIIKVVIEDVEIESVAVHWQCRAYSKDGAGSEKEQPRLLIQGDDIKRLKLLSVFEPCTLQVGDRHTYTIKPTDQISTKDQWRKEQKRLILKHDSNKFKDTPNIQKNLHKDSPSKTKKLTNNINKSENDCNKSKLQTENGHLEVGINESVTITEAGENISTETNSTDWNTESSEEESESASNTSSIGSIISNGGKKHPSLPVRTLTKVLHKKKLRRTAQKKTMPNVNIEPGNKVIVETISTSSTADVVWQDGSVEVGIPSTELYPIHHLDDQEFFPGDFVIENREEACMRVYGVVQTVDHAGRTASVKWFKTYTSTDSPQPTLLMENEVSVYDLKDHPDFQYRPGTVVIRVANFQGEDEVCTAGQVLDNYPEGRVRVWWVEGHISMCWPQDLYKVGEYDSDGGEHWDDGPSDDNSWQTESEASNEENTDDTHNESLKPKLAANIEKARIAMSRLEEIFTQNPSLQTTEVMRKLLEVYKDCRYLDKLMGTMFFHESHFEGLLERVREKGRTNPAQRVADQVSRLFSHNEISGGEDVILTVEEVRKSKSKEDFTVENKGDEKIVEDVPEEKSRRDSSGEFLTGSLASLEARISASRLVSGPPVSNDTNNHPVSNQNVAANVNVQNQPVCSVNVCVRLCSLILAQLVKAHAEVIRRFGGNTGSMSEANSVSPSGPLTEKTETSGANGFPELKENGDIDTKDGSNLVIPNSLAELNSTIEVNSNECIIKPNEKGVFTILDTAPNSHKFKLTMFQPTDTKSFFRRVRGEIKLLRTSLPSGIWITGFEDRMDLFSVMIRGPERTPYEDGLFFFDFQLSADYPKTPPHCHYISYCSDRLNPNLYEDGKVCVSLLGTWSGKGTEVWTLTSNLLQIIVSIQGLILVSEPYFNEAGYEKQKGSQQGKENSRMYNEMVVLKLVQAMTKLIVNPPPVFREEINAHFNQHAEKLCQRLDSWLDISEKYNNSHPLSPTTPTSYKDLLAEVGEVADGIALPEFPLIPASKGFCLTLRKTLVTFRQALADKRNMNNGLPS